MFSSIGSVADRPTKRKATAPPAGSPGFKGNSNSLLVQAYRMFARTGKCNWSPYKFLNKAPTASASSPSPLARREDGGGSVAAAGGGSRALSLRAVFPEGGSRGGEGVEALVLVLDEDTGPAARWGKPLRAQLQRRRWM